MTETLHTRSRRASLAGLALQMVATFALFTLFVYSKSWAVQHAAFVMLGGIPLWIITLLIFRQREIAELESLDLEQLRREKQSAGVAETMFGEFGGAYRVAENRLQFMQRWFVPLFSLFHIAYLGGMGFWISWFLRSKSLSVGSPAWPEMDRDVRPLTMIVAAVIMLIAFLFSRYFTGMARVKDWQLLRAGGSFLFGGAFVLAAIVVAVGAGIYISDSRWEQAVAYAIPWMMMILAAETAVIFIADIYSPRAKDEERRAPFDSGLLGLLASPEAFARNIAEALNYQFGFQVSQTWFYQFLQRWALPLAWCGAAILWLQTSIVLVQPYERAIVERFGRPLNTATPLSAGMHFKAPWPIDIANTYNTGQLHEIVVGFKVFDAEAKHDDSKKSTVLLWSDPTHMGQEHFDFLISPTQNEPPKTTQPADVDPYASAAESANSAAVNMIRMSVVVQFRIEEDQLADYMRTMITPEAIVRNIAWAEVGRFVASKNVDSLLGEDLGAYSTALFTAIADRVREQKIGIKVIYVGLANVHPDSTVTEAFREVIKAQQEKTLAVRKALVDENTTLAKVAGDKDRALALSQAISRSREADQRKNAALTRVGAADPAGVTKLLDDLRGKSDAFNRRIEAGYRHDLAVQRAAQINDELELGLGQTLANRDAAAAAVTTAQAALKAAEDALTQEIATIRANAEKRFDAKIAEAAIAAVDADLSVAFWNRRIEVQLQTIEGAASKILAGAFEARWAIEMEYVGNLAMQRNEIEAFRRSPRIYKIRKYLQTLTEGMKDRRKFFLAFDPEGKEVKIRYNAETQIRQGLDRDISPPRR